MEEREERYRNAVKRASAMTPDKNVQLWTSHPALGLDAISSFVSIDTQMPQTAEPEGSELRFNMIVARAGREGPAVSVKFANISREISRTVWATLLFGVASHTVDSRSDPVRALTVLASFMYAAYTATRTTIGYSDACVLHKAWRLAGSRADRTFTRDEIIAVKHEIVRDYRAPKCVSDTEIDDAIENLCGLMALRRAEGRYVLMEKIIFFTDGRILN